MYLFPVIFAISGVNFPIGVLIYWTTTNFWTWGQQFWVIKNNPTPGSPAYLELQAKKAAKGLIELPQEEAQKDGSQTNTGQRQQPKKKKRK